MEVNGKKAIPGVSHSGRGLYISEPSALQVATLKANAARHVRSAGFYRLWILPFLRHSLVAEGLLWRECPLTK